MSFLWGGREKFEKDDNTIRGVYKLNPFFGKISKTKKYIFPFIYNLNVSDSDSIELFGGIPNTVYSIIQNELSVMKYRHFFIPTEDITVLGGIAYENELKVLRNSFVITRYIHYPFSDYITESTDVCGSVIFIVKKVIL
jgi:hypothetical protein